MTSRARYVLVRVGGLVATLLVTSFLVFSSIYLAPGDPISGLTIFDESDGRVEHRDPSVRASGLAIGAGSIAYTEGFAPKAAVVVERLP